MSTATTRRTRPVAAASNVTKAKRNRRVSLGTCFDTTNVNFYSGRIQGANGQYANQSELLTLLGEAPEGFKWQIKAWVVDYKDADGNARTRLDIVAEIEPLKIR